MAMRAMRSLPLLLGSALSVVSFSATSGSKSLDESLKKLEEGLKTEAKGRLEGEQKRPVDEDAGIAEPEPASGAAKSIPESEASSGIREALAKGVERAIGQLGREDGFLADQAVKIAAPKKMRNVVDLARKLGADKYVDRFEVSMNRAAEKAVPAAASILGDSIREMSVSDAVGLVRGGDTAATDYFRRTAGDELRATFLPIIQQSTESAGVTKSYKKLVEKAGGGLGGLLDADDLDLDAYVTEKALDGLFHYIGVQEQAIRENPLGQASSLLRRVFVR